MRILVLLLVGCTTPSPLEGATIEISDDLEPPIADGHLSVVVRVAVPCELAGLGGSFRGAAMTVVPGDCPTLEIDPASVTPTSDVIEVHDSTTTIVAPLTADLLDVRHVEMTATLCAGQSVTATWSHPDDLGDGDGNVTWAETYPTLDGAPSGNWQTATTAVATGFAFDVPARGAGVPRPGSSGDGQAEIVLENAETTGTVDCAPATCGNHFRHPALTAAQYVTTCP